MQELWLRAASLPYFRVRGTRRVSPLPRDRRARAFLRLPLARPRAGPKRANCKIAHAGLGREVQAATRAGGTGARGAGAASPPAPFAGEGLGEGLRRRSADPDVDMGGGRPSRAAVAHSMSALAGRTAGDGPNADDGRARARHGASRALRYDRSGQRPTHARSGGRFERFGGKPRAACATLACITEGIVFAGKCILGPANWPEPRQIVLQPKPSVGRLRLVAPLPGPRGGDWRRGIRNWLRGAKDAMADLLGRVGRTR